MDMWLLIASGGLSLIALSLSILRSASKNRVEDLEDGLEEASNFCRQQVEINNLLVEENIKVKNEVSSWDEVTKDVDVTDLVTSMGSNSDTGSGGARVTKEMDVIDHKWS